MTPRPREITITRGAEHTTLFTSTSRFHHITYHIVPFLFSLFILFYLFLSCFSHRVGHPLCDSVCLFVVFVTFYLPFISARPLRFQDPSMSVSHVLNWLPIDDIQIILVICLVISSNIMICLVVMFE